MRKVALNSTYQTIYLCKFQLIWRALYCETYLENLTVGKRSFWLMEITQLGQPKIFSPRSRLIDNLHVYFVRQSTPIAHSRVEICLNTKLCCLSQRTQSALVLRIMASKPLNQFSQANAFVRCGPSLSRVAQRWSRGTEQLQYSEQHHRMQTQPLWFGAAVWHIPGFW